MLALNIFIAILKKPEYSLLDGLARVEEYAERSVEIGQHYLCISDHGMMACVPRQIRACEEIAQKGHSLSPIFASELYLQNKHCSEEDRKHLSPEEFKEHRKSYHLLAIAYNLTGYTNLIKLTSWGWLNGFYYKPRINYEQLNKHKEGIIFTSCCYIGEIGQAFDRGGPEAGEAMLQKYMAMFGENFYLELMLLDFTKQKPYDTWIIKMHDKYHIPIILTQDCLVKNSVIITDKGSKYIQDVVIGDNVLTHKNEFKKVEVINSRKLDKDEKIYRVKASIGTLAWEATGNHLVRVAEVKNKKWNITRKEVKNLGWKRIDELSKNDYIVIPKIKKEQVFAKETLKQIDLFEYIKDYSTTSSHSLLLKDDVFISHHGWDKRNTIKIPRFLNVDDDLLKILGLYIAEGGLDGNSNSVDFGLHVREIEESNLVKRFFNKFGIKIYEKINRNGIRLAFTSALFRQFFENICGIGSKNKQLPMINGSFFGKFSEKQVLTILLQYIKGDGHNPRKHERPGCFGSTSKKLIYDISIIFNSLGFPTIPSYRDNKNLKHKNPKANPENWNKWYYLAFSGNPRVRLNNLLYDTNNKEKDNPSNRGLRYIEFDDGYAVRIRKIKEIEYDDFVYNLQVADHESYVSGMAQAHNCHYCFKGDSKYQQYMLMMQKGSTIADIKKKQEGEDGQDIFELQDTNLWMKSEDELNEKWLERVAPTLEYPNGFSYSDIIPLDLYQQAKYNTVKICEKAKGIQIDREAKLPQIPDDKEKFLDALKAGMKWRGVLRDKKYQERIYEESELIIRKGFASYFLIQKMFVDEARRVAPLPEFLGWGTGHEACGAGRGCLSPDTPIVLANGRIKPICEIKVGEQVIVRDGNIGLVDKVYNYDCNEELLKIITYYGDQNNGCTLTKDHMVFCEKMQRPKNYCTWTESSKKNRKSIREPIFNLKWMRADEIEIGDWLWFPKIKINEQEKDPIDLLQYCNFTCSFDEHTITKKNKQQLRYIEQDDDFFKILGIFTGDGWIRKRGDASVGFCFNSETNLDSLQFVQDYLTKKQIKFSYRQSKNKKLIQLHALSKPYYCMFRDLFNDYQHTSATKHIPRCVFTASESQRLAYLNGYFLADGSVGLTNKEHKIKFTTSSERLADEIKFICNTLGLPASLSKVVRTDKRWETKSLECSIRIPKTKEISGEDYQNRQVFRTSENGFLIKVRKIESVKDNRKVWDLSVSSDETYLTSSFLVHNSGVGSLCNYVLGITDVDPIKHGLLFSRFLNESRGGKTIKTRFTQTPIKT